jgi:crossover junction endodeoxyribonuclease RuvC
VRVLGVDPGLSRCGIGVVDGPASRPSAVRAGVIRTAPTQRHGRRLAAVHAELEALLAQTRPDCVALERVFANAQAGTAVGVAQVAGLVHLCAERAGVAVSEYTPSQVKAAVAGTGAADKQQVTFMVRAVLGLREAPRPADAADALALALCHLQTGGALGEGSGRSARLAAAVAAAGPGAQRVEQP